MSDLPSHPDTDPPAHRVGVASEAPIARSSSRRKWLVTAAVVGVLVLFVVLHLTGVVGSEAH